MVSFKLRITLFLRTTLALKYLTLVYLCAIISHPSNFTSTRSRFQAISAIPAAILTTNCWYENVKTSKNFSLLWKWRDFYLAHTKNHAIQEDICIRVGFGKCHAYNQVKPDNLCRFFLSIRYDTSIKFCVKFIINCKLLLRLYTYTDLWVCQGGRLSFKWW